MATRSALINVMARAAEKAARALVRDFGEVEQLQVSRKGPGDFVSNADLKAEKTIREELERARPDFGFLMEESGERPGKTAGTRWIVDPLDGTLNFLHGLPHWAISIALEVDGQIAAGVVHDPVKDELFWAEKGAGAFMNSRRLRVSGRTRMADALVATGIPWAERAEDPVFIGQLDRVMKASSGIRRYGAASLDLAYVAAGRYDGFWETGLKPWDVAAGTLIVAEAGGFVAEIGGRSRNGMEPVMNGSIVAANGQLLAPLDKLLTAGTA